MRGDLRANKPVERRPYLNSVIRDRLKKPDTDIAQVWHEQSYLEKHRKRAADKKKNVFTFANKFLRSIISRLRLNQIKTAFNVVKNLTSSHRKATLVGLFIFTFAGIFIFKNLSPEYPSASLGESTTNLDSADAVKTVAQSETAFPLLYPAGREKSGLTLALISPPEHDPAYAYIDRLRGEEIKVSQQRVPESFKSQEDIKLQELAKNFQATSVIQIDSLKVYHGYSESIKTQSLVFIKKGNLVFVASPKKFNDEVWVAYITSLR